MIISIAPVREDLIKYLSSNLSIKVENTYVNLEQEIDQFKNDINLVDIFLLIDNEDLFPTLTAMMKVVSKKETYMFRPHEIVLVTNEDPKKSPTQDSKGKFDAFQRQMGAAGYEVRIERLKVMDLTSVYKAFSKETSLDGDDLKKLTKYKAYKSKGSVALRPRKTKENIVPETGQVDPQLMIEKDARTASMSGEKKINLSETSLAVQKSSRASIDSALVGITIPETVFVTGIRYIGKSTVTLEIANAFTRLGKSIVGVDLTNRNDWGQLMSWNTKEYLVLKGNSVFRKNSEGSVFINLFHKALNTSFLEELPQVYNRSQIYCETDFENVPALLSSSKASKQVIVVMEYDFTKIRDTELKVKELVKQSPEAVIHVIINNRDLDQGDLKDMTDLLNQRLPMLDTIVSSDNVMPLLERMEVV